MQLSLMADDDIGMVDSVAGLRHILTDIATSDADDDNKIISLDNGTADEQPADSNTVTTEVEEKSYENLDASSEMEKKCSDSDRTMGANEYSEDNKTAGEHEISSEKEMKSTNDDEVDKGSQQRDNEVIISGDRAEALEESLSAKQPSTAAAATDHGDGKCEVDQHSSVLAQICTNYDDDEQVRFNLHMLVLLNIIRLHRMHEMHTVVTRCLSVSLSRGSARLHCVGIIRCSLYQITLADCYSEH